MNIKQWLRWLHDRLYNYNVFIPEENDYEDENDQSIDPTTMIRHQRYATRLYIPLITVMFYILFFINLMNPHSEIVTISNITPLLFDQLQSKYSETLSCPCQTTTILFKDFVSNQVSFHPVCSSIYVSEEWIKALYLPDSSQFLVMDFRTTASYQVSEIGFC
ncbi:unnamed protein product [Adineta steineri]|uniref:Uncharacterized protein n=1 Tax=Adineta steineri TaxID=433720 RepID=A0A819E5E4_9BILA|nr:unnamed protein product [Adineta steineri]CAF3844464.1 unnamed protein product [Adineta steineri]